MPPESVSTTASEPTNLSVVPSVRIVKAEAVVSTKKVYVVPTLFSVLGSSPGPLVVGFASALMVGSVMTKVASLVRIILPAYVATSKVIVFVPLTGTLHMLERELSKHWTVSVVNGAVSAAKRNQIFNDFQNQRDPRVLIAHPATMAHGLTLTAANTVVWYGPIASNEQYVQANGRVERIGKRHVSNVIHIESTAVERKLYARLHGKQKLQGLLLEVIQDMTRGKNGA